MRVEMEWNGIEVIPAIVDSEGFVFGDRRELKNRMRIRAKFFLGQDERYDGLNLGMRDGAVKVEEFGLVQLVMSSNRSTLVTFADSMVKCRESRRVKGISLDKRESEDAAVKTVWYDNEACQSAANSDFQTLRKNEEADTREEFYMSVILDDTPSSSTFKMLAERNRQLAEAESLPTKVVEVEYSLDDEYLVLAAARLRDSDEIGSRWEIYCGAVWGFKVVDFIFGESARPECELVRNKGYLSSDFRFLTAAEVMNFLVERRVVGGQFKVDDSGVAIENIMKMKLPVENAEGGTEWLP